MDAPGIADVGTDTGNDVWGDANAASMLTPCCGGALGVGGVGSADAVSGAVTTGVVAGNPEDTAPGTGKLLGACACIDSEGIAAASGVGIVAAGMDTGGVTDAGNCAILEGGTVAAGACATA